MMKRLVAIVFAVSAFMVGSGVTLWPLMKATITRSWGQ